jgi:hypothetical protein
VAGNRAELDQAALSSLLTTAIAAARTEPLAPVGSLTRFVDRLEPSRSRAAGPSARIATTPGTVMLTTADRAGYLRKLR